MGCARCLRDDRPKHILYQRGDLIDLVFEIHSQIQRHLIVPAAGGVEHFAHIPQPLGQHLLDEHVDVLAAKVEFQRPGFQIGQNARQTVDDRIRIRLRQNAALGKHCCMRHGAGDILPVHPSVDGDRRVECVSQCRSLRLRPARPKLVHGAFSLHDICKASPCHAPHGKGRWIFTASPAPAAPAPWSAGPRC